MLIDSKKANSIQAIKQAIDYNNKKRELQKENKEDTKIRVLLEEYLKRDDKPERLALLEEYKNGAAITGPEGLRKKLGAIDLEYFGKAYLPHYFFRNGPDFHRELDNLWSNNVIKGFNVFDDQEARMVNTCDGSHNAVAAPRGHAKSTNLTFKDTLHAIVYRYKRYPIILSDSSEQAEGFLQSIKDELEENEALIEDFGKLQGDIWRNNVIVTNTGIKVEAIGSGKKIRGRKHKNWRPDLLILDDIENDENVNTPEQRKKLRNWFYKAVSKCGDTYTDIVYIGTVLHYDSLLINVLKNPTYKGIKYKAVISDTENPELWDQWKEIFTDLDNDNREVDAKAFFEAHKEKMLEGTRVLWPDKLSYYDLMVIKVSEGDAAFNSELQNEPINPDDCLFNMDVMDYYNPAEIDFKDKSYIFIGYVDPSLGKSKKSNYSAIITLAKHKKSGYMYVVDADITRRHPSRIIEDCIQKEIWLKKDFGRGYTKFGCETVQFQWFLKEELAKASSAAGIYLPIVEVPQTTDKILRISTLEPDINNKYLKFNKKHKLLLEQLQYFPMASNDDGPDALEGARTLAKKAKFSILGLTS